jgi:hypothetical protein
LLGISWVGQEKEMAILQPDHLTRSGCPERRQNFRDTTQFKIAPRTDGNKVKLAFTDILSNNDQPD